MPRHAQSAESVGDGSAGSVLPSTTKDRCSGGSVSGRGPAMRHVAIIVLISTSLSR